MSQLKNSITCIQCNISFQGYRTAKYCSKHCSKVATNTVKIQRMVADSIVKFPEGTSLGSFVVCGICGYRSSDLAQHPSIHGLSQKEYRAKYGEIKSQVKKQMIEGEQNPGYQHGGRLSPFSKKFVNYTDDIAIEDLKQRAVQTKSQNNTNPLSTNYYTSKGIDEAVAIELIRERQTTFSLDICVSKYGKELGLDIWTKRQESWINTLNAKTDEEKLEINRKKLWRGGNSSKQEKRLYEDIKEVLPDIETQFMIKKNCGTKYYAFDIRLSKKLIEFNGDFWHANPNKYSAEDIVNRPGSASQIKAKDIWDSDSVKLHVAIESGYDVMVVWESDYKRNKKAIIQQCINFLTQ